jgi:hypothetical protein
MKKYTGSTVVLFVFIVLLSGCATAIRYDQDEYGLLDSAVTSCASVTIGVYADTVPSDLTLEKLLSVCENQIPENYFTVLKKYPSDVKPKGSYYLLLIYDLDNKDLIMFHYSCSPKPARVIAQPGKYDLNNLDSYDTCKGN